MARPRTKARLHASQKLIAYFQLRIQSREQLAEACGVSVPTVSRWTTRNAEPSLSMAAKIYRVTAGFVEPNDWCDLEETA